jgi:uncharacterized membrane protein
MAGEKTEEKPAPKSGGGDDGLFGALCYIISVLVPLFVLFTDKKSNKFLAFHAWQSLILSVVLFVFFFGFMAVTMVLTIVTGGVAGILNCLLLPIWFVAILGVLVIAYKAYKGERYKIPVIGDFAEKQAGK